MHPLMAGMSNLKYPTLSEALPAVTDPSCQLIQAADSREQKTHKHILSQETLVESQTYCK